MHIHAADANVKSRLKVSIALTGAIFVAEIVGGFMTNSLALISDAVHVFMDVLALSLSLFAIYISDLPPSEKRTYGLHRAEVFVSFINSSVLFLVTLFIFYKAYSRLMNPEPVESMGMLVVAAVGLAINLVVALWLRRHAKTDMNVRSAFLHVVGDAAASVGVIIGAVVIETTGWHVADPAISFAIGGIILFGAWSIMRDSSHILLEGVPKGIAFSEVLDDINASRGVLSVHSLHIWSICHNVYALSAHLDIAPVERRRTGEIMREINERLARKHHIFYTTLQPECSGCDLNDTFGAVAHRDREHLH